jgi:hypothetical protein
MGVSPQDIDALASGRAPSRVVLEAMCEWLGGRQALMRDELEDYERLRDSTRQTAVAIPSGAPGRQQGVAPRPGPSRRTLIAAATATAIMVIAITVVLTVVITRPGSADTSAEATSPPTATSPSGSPSPAAASASPTATSTKTEAPATATGSPTPSSAASGELLGKYSNFQLPCNFTLAFGSGGAPQPVAWQPSLTNYDLENDCSGASVYADPNMFDTSTGEVALLTGAPTYANCAADTDLGGNLSSLVQGNTICYQGHGMLAAATIVAFGSGGGNDYAELNVQVWQYPQADPQGNSGG